MCPGSGHHALSSLARTRTAAQRARWQRVLVWPLLGCVGKLRIVRPAQARPDLDGGIRTVPNCDFYAALEDHELLLDWLFRESTCRVFELSSDFETPLREFRAVADVLAQFTRAYPNGRRWHTVHLQLHVLGAGPPFVPTRVTLDPRACQGATFRFVARGWGLVQLYLSVPDATGLMNSHTNHNSRKRAETWASVTPEAQSVGSWDFKRVTAFSSRLNRQVKKMGVARIASRAVLPGALRLWEGGVPLLPFRPDGPLQLVRNGA